MKIDIKYDNNGLIPAIVQDYLTGKILMQAYMNEEALTKTLSTKQMWFWSRSRQELWHKGATSGQIHHVVEAYADCDYDSLLFRVVRDTDISCHEGTNSCYHHPLLEHKDVNDMPPASFADNLYQVIQSRKASPLPNSYTNSLLSGGKGKYLKKVTEEAGEVVIAFLSEDKERQISEVSDLLYHLEIALADNGITLADIMKHLEARHNKK
jgi:phosphoribosyl-ATP pyrophosphohydrolase/phosphoribosyl-AMP cyclohydrolase